MIEIRILSFDQSTKSTGWSFWENNKLKRWGLLNSNIKENNPIARMRKMGGLAESLIDEIKPDYIVIENVQFQRNYCTYKLLSQLQGVLFELFFKKDIGFTIVEATAWKSFCGVKGKKRAEQKENTIQIIHDKFGINPTSDEADAIGIGWWAVNNLKEL